ncbi:MAG TPA: YkgJ family cysteine cluster protein [Candidatus Sulfotelmatobacter sp.]|nr:YkgJ family cysteine cluster protein [Candidatus Sulfotelmatobacter sp.]
MRAFLPQADQQLIQIVDAAFAESAKKSGDWLLCRKGCTQCCFSPFPINQLDAARLRQGLRDLEGNDPQCATRVRARASEAVTKLSPNFPGDPATGILDDDEEAEARFADFANDEPCPALDPATGTCDLYYARPMTCRTFGPPVRSGAEGGLAVCELCYHGASDQQIASCEMVPDPEDLESKLLHEIEKKTGTQGNTIVAFALNMSSPVK